MRTLTFILLILLFCGATRADVIHLKDGRKLEGEIIDETTSHIVLKLSFGEQKIARSDIARIEKKSSPRAEFLERLEALQKDDVSGRVELARFAMKNRLRKEAKSLWEEVVKLEAGNTEAHEELGHVQHRGKWVTRAEKRRLEREVDNKAKRSSGKVKFGGRWVTPEEKEALEKGLVKDGDEWVTSEEKDRREEEKRMLAKGLVRFEGRWVGKDDVPYLEKGMFQVEGRWMTAEEADRIRTRWDTAWELPEPNGWFVLRTDRPHKEASDLAYELSDAVKMAQRLYDRPLGSDPIGIYVVGDLAAYQGYAEQYGGGVKSSGLGCFLVDQPENVLNPRQGPVGWNQKRGVTYYYVSQGKARHTINWIHHLVGELYTDRISRGRAPFWFQQCFAAYLERYRSPLEISVHRTRLQELPRPVAISDLMTEFYVGPDQQQADAYFLTGGYLVHYLLETDHAGDRQAFVEYRKSVASGDVDATTFQRLLGDPSALEGRLREHLKK